MSRSSTRTLEDTFSALCLSSRTPTSTFHLRQPLATLRRTSQASARSFSSCSRQDDWLRPDKAETRKSMVGRPRMATGGSIRGTTVVWGDYGLRLKDHDRRISAKQLQLGYDTITRKLRGMNYKLYTRVSANIGVYTKGNEVRMGKGKGKFDYWAARVPVSRIVFEISGPVHEKVIKEAFRLAGAKLPGLWEVVRKGDPPVVGITKLGDGVTLESLKAARKQIEPRDKEGEEGLVVGADRLPPPQTVSTSMSATV